MQDKTWLLKPSSIKAAKTCIQLVHAELNIKLTLSHPNFLDMLNDYAELTDSEQLQEAVNTLNTLAGVEPTQTDQGNGSATVISHPAQNARPERDTRREDSAELVLFGGKKYPRWSEGKEFTGLYRGQPRYG